MTGNMMIEWRAACILLCVSFLLAASDGSTKTWHVRKDGTGDFTVIQDAADAAANGDTILIGAGTYREQSEVQVGQTLVRLVAVAICQEDITIRGVHRDSVLIEQVDYNNDGFGVSMCFPASKNLRVESMTLRNYREGITTVDRCTVKDVRILRCANGIGVDEGELVLSESVLDSARSIGVFAKSLSTSVEIRNCSFTASESFAFQLFGTPSAVVEDCEFLGGNIGPSVVEGGSAVMRRCMISGQSSYGVDLGNGAELELYDSTIQGAFANIIFRSNRTLIGTRNVLRASSRAPMYRIRPMETLDFRDNEILLGDSLFVEAVGAQTGVIDLSGNWWGTTDPEFVSTHIVDANADSTVGPEVVFEPMLQQKVPVEERSISSMKARH